MLNKSLAYTLQTTYGLSSYMGAPQVVRCGISGHVDYLQSPYFNNKLNLMSVQLPQC